MTTRRQSFAVGPPPLTAHTDHRRGSPVALASRPRLSGRFVGALFPLGVSGPHQFRHDQPTRSPRCLYHPRVIGDKNLTKFPEKLRNPTPTRLLQTTPP